MKPKSPSPKSIPELEAAALRALKGGYYRDAVAAFKDLIKRERRRDWEEKLAEAYLGRAREVARKGMFQEAAMLWENHAGFHPGLPPTEEYLDWLLQAGQAAKLGQALAAAPEALRQSRHGLRLMEGVALLALSDEKLLKALPGDHAAAKQQPVLRQAIAAYAGGRDAEAEDCLRQVSSRSPYRNLRTLLKGLLVLGRDPAAAAEIFDRVDADSACRGFALALREQAETTAPETERYLASPPRQRAAIDKLKGYDKSQLALLRDIRKAAEAKSVRPLLETVLRHRGELGEATSRRFCHAALADCADAIPLYERAFGKLSPFEQHRLRALNAETEQDHPRASRHWHAAIDCLQAAPAGRQEPLTQALIHRHIAELAEHEVPAMAIDCLEKSLDLDPEDKPTYLKLIELHEREEDPKAGQSWLDQALGHYPKDPEVLLLAMQSAQRRKAYKKVAAHARTLLEIDPINSQARRYLLEAHLGHARKQMRSERLDSAEQELAEARKLDPQRRNAALLYAEGLLAFLGADNERCRTLWREAGTAAGGGVAAWFQWAMEVLGVGLPLTGPGRLVEGLDKKYVAGKAELVALARMLGQYAAESRQNISEALRKLAPVLKRSFKQAQLGEDDFFGLCQGLAHVAQYELLAECAKQGARRSQYAPVFRYFEVVAKCKGDARRLAPLEQYRLQMALEDAHRAGDRRAVALIDQFLNKHEESQQPDFDEMFPDGFPALDEFGEGPARQFLERMQEFDRLTPEARAQALLGDHGAEALQNLSEKEAMDLILGKLLEGMDIGEMPGGLPPGGARKPKKKR